ncbi:hypothetical protein CW304_07860 [Bacillus sp. UFRGS-B20]|nr:hypothetical protein CW304_07860 [Bacillus sp. UFRGS-B20]
MSSHVTYSYCYQLVHTSPLRLWRFWRSGAASLNRCVVIFISWVLLAFANVKQNYGKKDALPVFFFYPT